MKATYQNNFLKIKSILSPSNNKLLAQSLNKINLDKHVHDHTQYSLGTWSDQYYSPLNHINLFQIISTDQLKKIPFILSRDGLFTLVDFFNRFPTPKGFNTIFIINEKFKNFIPQGWNNSILFFNFEINQDYYSTKTFNDHLIIKGHIMKDAFDIDHFSKTFKIIKKQKRIKRILLCLSQRQNYFLQEGWHADMDFAQLSNSFMKTLYTDLVKDIDIEFICWKTFFTMQNIHKYEFWDANNKDVIYLDDYSDAFLFRKGSKPFFLNPKESKNIEDLMIQLTEAYSVNILKSPVASKVNNWEYLNNIFKILEIKKGQKLNSSAYQAIRKLYYSQNLNQQK